MLGDTCSPLAALAYPESVGVGVAMEAILPLCRVGKVDALAGLENAAGTVKDQRQAREIFDFGDSSR